MNYSIEKFARLCVSDDGKPIHLFPHQVKILDYILTPGSDRRLKHDIAIFSAIKKSGKTTIGGIVSIKTALERPNSIILTPANDLEQSQSRVFRDCKAFLERNPILFKEVKSITQSVISFNNGSEIRAVASDYKGAAGERYVLVVYDELWAYSSEAAVRLFEELTPHPLFPCLILIVSYAGLTGESTLLESLYKRGLAGNQVWDDLPCYENKRLFMYWDHLPRMPWQTPEYYEAQREILRPHTYLRLHENRWVSGEEQFIPIDWWDKAATGTPAVADRIPVILGVDAGLKRDSAAVVACTYNHEIKKVRLVNHRIFYPQKGETLDIEETLEETVRDFVRRYDVKEVRYDPWQFQRSAQTLVKEGIRMTEYPQSIPNLTAMTQNLYELLKGENLITYPDNEIRLAIQRAVTVETSRGMRITKEKASHKIDVVVALAMAAHGAVLNLSQYSQDIGPVFTDDREVISWQDWESRVEDEYPAGWDI